MPDDTYIKINNRSSVSFGTDQSTSSGTWEKSPPASVNANETNVRAHLHDGGFMTGTTGDIQLTASDGTKIVIKFNCPEEGDNEGSVSYTPGSDYKLKVWGKYNEGSDVPNWVCGYYDTMPDSGHPIGVECNIEDA